MLLDGIYGELTGQMEQIGDSISLTQAYDIPNSGTITGSETHYSISPSGNILIDYFIVSEEQGRKYLIQNSAPWGFVIDITETNVPAIIHF